MKRLFTSVALESDKPAPTAMQRLLEQRRTEAREQSSHALAVEGIFDFLKKKDDHDYSKIQEEFGEIQARAGEAGELQDASPLRLSNRVKYITMGGSVVQDPAKIVAEMERLTAVAHAFASEYPVQMEQLVNAVISEVIQPAAQADNLTEDLSEDFEHKHESRFPPTLAKMLTRHRPVQLHGKQHSFMASDNFLGDWFFANSHQAVEGKGWTRLRLGLEVELDTKREVHGTNFKPWDRVGLQAVTAACVKHDAAMKQIVQMIQRLKPLTHKLNAALIALDTKHPKWDSMKHTEPVYKAVMAGITTQLDLEDYDDQRLHMCMLLDSPLTTLIKICHLSLARMA